MGEEKKEEPPIHEGFVVPEGESFHLSACPTGLNTFYDSAGNLLCCDGEVIGSKCIGKKQCTLSSTASGDTPTCISLLQASYTEKSDTFCPSTMPSYYEDLAAKKKGCTAGRLNPTMTGPRNVSDASCVIYPTLEENLNAKDSCHHVKKKEEFPCFGTDCRKEIVQPKAGAPSLVAVHFTDPTGMFHIAYTRESMEQYLNATQPRWREQGLDLEKNVQVAEVAKAYFVDKSIKDIQL